VSDAAASGASGGAEPATGWIEAVVFDLGGVCIDWDPRHLFRSLFDGDDAAMEYFLAEVCNRDWNAQLDEGRPWAEAVEDLSRRHPEFRAHIVAFRERWAEMLGGAIDDTVAVLDRLHRAGVPLFALSNWSAETYPIARPKFPFLEWFDGVVISGEERIRKPDPRIFRLLLERYGLRAESTAFIDDVAENVAAAQAIGFVGLLYRDGDGLRHDLGRLGLPVG
jgi:2-haloacid dehalogenase